MAIVSRVKMVRVPMEESSLRVKMVRVPMEESSLIVSPAEAAAEARGETPADEIEVEPVEPANQ